MCMQLKNYIYQSDLFKIVSLFLAGLVLHCYTWAFFSCSESGYFLVAMHRLLIVAVLLAAEYGLLGNLSFSSAACGLSTCSLWAPEHGLSLFTCLVAMWHGESSRTRDWNPFLLHQKAASSPLDREGCCNVILTKCDSKRFNY